LVSICWDILRRIELAFHLSMSSVSHGLSLLYVEGILACVVRLRSGALGFKKV
jgi:hypothetical protein